MKRAATSSSWDFLIPWKLCLTCLYFLTRVHMAHSSLPYPYEIEMGLKDEKRTIETGTGADPGIGTSLSTNTSHLKDINIFILLPHDSKYRASIMLTGPAMHLGWVRVQESGLLPGYRVNLNYRDTNCSNIIAPMEAMRARVCVSEKVHAFFGPSCELALAPVARFLKFWNVPLLSAGALTFDYTENKTTNDTEYFLLTKTGISFTGVTNFILQCFKRFAWKKVLLMYDKDALEEVSGSQTCKFFMSTMVEYLNDKRWIFDNLDLGNNANITLKERMGKAMGIKFSTLHVKT